MTHLGHLPSIGETIDRYTVLAELAHGGMAAVYVVGRATGHFDKLLAMKVMLPHLVSEKKFVDMFVDEARIAANVQNPNVVQVFDVGEHKGTPYMVMEYLRGQSMSAVTRRVDLSPAQILEVLASTADGLHAAHETCDPAGVPLQIVHRDVSPQNIHMSYDGSVKVVDFGIAAAQGRITQTRTGEMKGKLSYAAPEQLRAKSEVDRRLDLWALGVIAWEMLAGERLFKGDTDADTMYNVLHKRVPLLAGLPLEVAEIVSSCVQRNVELRPSTAAEVSRVLRGASQALGGADRGSIGAAVVEAFADERVQEAERVAAAVARPKAPPKARARWIGVAGAIAVVGALAGGVYWGRTNPTVAVEVQPELESDDPSPQDNERANDTMEAPLEVLAEPPELPPAGSKAPMRRSMRSIPRVRATMEPIDLMPVTF